MVYEHILTDVDEGVGTITLNRPDKLNAMNRKLSAELHEAIKRMDGDEAVGCIVITGSGTKAFSAGGDIHEQREDDRRYTPEQLDAMREGRRAYDISASAKPTIGMMNGLAFGGAAVLSSSLDMRIGCEDTKFRFLAAAYGRINSTWSLGAQIGWPMAKELLFTARIVEAEEAFRIGLLNHLVPRAQLRDKTMEIARMIANNHRGAVIGVKQLLLQQKGESLEQQYEIEAHYTTHVMRGAKAEDAFPDFIARKGRALCLMAIKYEKRDGVAYITLNNPAKANIFDKETSDEISAAWIDMWEDRDIRCAILTGAGDRHFCGGHNLAPRKNITEEEREYLRTQRIFWPLAGTVNGQKTGVDGRFGDHYPRVWKPVIAAVNGWAAGAGLYVLLSSTDIRIASAENARFRFSLLSQGWIGHGPGASLLIKQLRYADAMKILLTDEPFDAQEALRVGLVNEVVPHAQLMERAERYARHIVKLPPVAVRMMKEFVVRFGDLPTDQAWQVQTLINNLLIQVTTDGEEGRAAFNAKRPPDFTGALRRRGEAWPELSEEDAERLDEAYRSGEF